MSSVAAAVAKLKHDPVLFVRQLLKAEPEPHQAKVMRWIASGERRVSVKSGRRIGKTTLMAWLSLWFEMTRANARTIVTAPSSAQLEDAYIPSFREWCQRLPPDLFEMWDIRAQRFDFRMTKRQGFENFVTIRTARADSPESLQGINAPNVLVLVDEAAGVGDANFESLSGSLGTKNAHMVLTGNPNRSSGYFYQTHTSLVDHWKTMTVNSEDCPMVSKEWVEEMKVKYGDTSNAYRIHVLGEFPTGDDNTVIPIELIEAAIGRDVVVTQHAPMIWGLDVARFGDDKSALCRRKGNTVTQMQTWRDLDTMQLAGAVQVEYEAALERPTEILIDVIGIGAGVVDRLREMGLPARGINVSESPAMGEQYVHLKDELWFKGLAWLEKRDCRLPNDEDLKQQLAMVRKDFTSNGKAKIESKRELRRRGVSSPDKADALMLTFASDAGTLIHGWSMTNWKQKLTRNLGIP